MNRIIQSKTICLLLAIVCSLALTFLTIAPPGIPADWARLDNWGISIPHAIAYQWPSYIVQIILWLGIVGGLWLGSRSPQSRKPDKNIISVLPQMAESAARSMGQIVDKWQVASLLLTLLGFGLRLYTLNRLPLIVDEIGFAAHASNILHGQFVPMFAPGHNANPSVYSWLVAGTMALFGQNAFAIRLVPLAFGTLSIPAAYVLGREWWSKRVGLLAAAFLATFPAHIFYSRMSLYNIVDPFFDMLAMAFLARAVATFSYASSDFQKINEHSVSAARRFFMLAGILAGIAQYFYHGSRMLPVLLIVFLILSAIKNDFRAANPRNRELSLNPHVAMFWQLCLQLFWIFMPFVLVTLPRFAPVMLGHLPITGNIDALRLPRDLGGNTMRAVLAWVGQPDVSPFWLSNQPLLPWPTTLVFLVGGWVCLRQWRDPRSIVLLLSLILTTILGGAILSAAPIYVRYITALPAIVLIAALGAEKILISTRMRGLRQKKLIPESKIVRIIGISFILAAGFYGMAISLYFHPAQAYDRINFGHWEEDMLARKAAVLPSGAAVVLAVSSQFGTDAYYGPLEIMSIADYVAAYGEQRVVVVSKDTPKDLAASIEHLNGQPYVILRYP